jgi:hypothetical protein
MVEHLAGYAFVVHGPRYARVIKTFDSGSAVEAYGRMACSGVR